MLTEDLYLIYFLFFLCNPLLSIFHFFFQPFIFPSLSLTSPDDSRTPALAQTWPTLMWNTRCAEEKEENDVEEGGRGENPGLVVRSVSIQSNLKEFIYL